MFTNIRTIGENELPGNGVYNPLATAVRNMRSASDQIQITLGNDGGILFDFLPDLNFLTFGAGVKIYAAFGGTLTTANGSTSLAVSAGKILMPGAAAISASGITIANVASGRKVWCAITASSAAISSGNAFPDYVTESNGAYTLNVRLMEIVMEDGELCLMYHHLGDIQLASVPYFWVAGYDPTAVQSLDHGAAGTLVWTTYGQCQQKS